MVLNINTNFKQQYIYIIILFFLSLFIRIPLIFLLGDVTIDNEWLLLLENLINHNTLALKEFDGFLLPNLLMPPLYAYYLYIFSLLNLENNFFILLILFSQTILSSMSVVIFYKINKLFFSKKISFYSSLVFSLFPIYLYSCTQISSISLTIFLALFFYYNFFKIINNKKYINILFFSIIAGLLILLRREFVGIIILSALYLLIYCRISKKKILLIGFITIITISPYLIRNYLIFNKVILHAGVGYNFWKANNSKSIVEGFEKFESDEAIHGQILEIPKDKFYRINEDKIFINEAVKNIKENPKRYLILYAKRTVSFFFIDLNSTYPNYYNPIHYIPIIILSVMSLIGILISDKKSLSFNYLILIIFFYIFIFSIFAILPRYKIYILPFQIIFANIFVKRIIKNN